MSFIVRLTIGREADKALNSPAEGRAQLEKYVVIEKPVTGGFASATCYLPDYTWIDVSGFTKEEMEHLKDIVESEAHMIFEFARTGGFDNAANL